MRDFQLCAAVLFAMDVRPIVALACNAGQPYQLRSQLRERSDPKDWTPLEAEDFCKRAIQKRIPTRERQVSAWTRLTRIAAGKSTFSIVADEREAQEVSDAEEAVRAIYGALLRLQAVR